MKVTLKDGKLSIDIHELMDGLSEAELIDLAESLSLQNEIIKRVMQQVMDGCTEDGSYGSMGSNPFAANSPLAAAKLRIAEESHILAKEQIERMRRHMAWREECHKETSDWAWRMYHEWPHSEIRHRPEWPR